MSDVNKNKYALPVGFRFSCGENYYTIEEVLGNGGFGITYKVMGHVFAGNIPIDTHFAIKEYFPSFCTRKSDNATINIPETEQQDVKDGINEFINEGKRLQEVCKHNPNIVNVNEVFKYNGTAYYVLEYLEGGDLRNLVHNNGAPLTEQQMLDVMIPVGRALQFLHDNHMLHLDIKPDNIVMHRNHLRGNDEPALIDFGLTTHYDENGIPTTKTPSQGISAGYSPVEQYSRITKFDPRIDIYAFSATCLYLLTGKDPLEATTLLQLPSNYIRSQIPATVSPTVARAIERGMSIAALNRPSSINTMLGMLTGEGSIDAPPLSPQTSSLPPQTHEDGTINIHNRGKIFHPASAAGASSRPKPKKSLFKKILIAGLIVFAIAAIIDIVKLVNKSVYFAEVKVVETPTTGNLTFKIGDLEFTMVNVEGGTFTMGATEEQGNVAWKDEKPAHDVSLSSFYIGQTEVTQELWVAFMGKNPSIYQGDKLPVTNVSWDECQEFIRKLNEKTGRNFRLPTEAEWEYAARGGNHSNHYVFSGSNNFDDVASWYMGNNGEATYEVDSKRANELGIYGMTGNVSEWCQDNWYYYDGSINDNSSRVHRGGSYMDSPVDSRVSKRNNYQHDRADATIGLRLAL